MKKHNPLIAKPRLVKGGLFSKLGCFERQSLPNRVILSALLYAITGALFSSTALAAVTTLTTSSNSPWTAPGTGIYTVAVECWGGGGSGGSVVKSSGTAYLAGGGGGGGAYASNSITVTGGNTYSFTVGAGGTVNMSAGNGNSGGSSLFYTNSVVAVAAAGGSSGFGGSASANTSYSGGAGGLASLSIGANIKNGGTGGNGNGTSATSGYGGGGGGSASSTTTPTTPSSATGSSTTGGGPGGNGSGPGNANANGNAPVSGPGGGGGGAQSHSGSPVQTGGAGADGQIVLTYTVPGVETIYTVLPGQSYVSGTGVSGSPNAQTAGSAFTITNYAIKPDLTVDTSYSGTKTVTISGPVAGTFAPTSTSVTFASGVGTVSITLTNAASTTIQCSTPDYIATASSALTVNAAAASQLVFTSSAMNTKAGTASFHITVQRQDAYGNPNTNGATIALTLSSTSTGVTTFSPASGSLQILNGFSTNSFTYTDTQAGHPTITASYSGLTSATQTETVTASNAVQLLVLMPGETATPGVAPGKSGSALPQRLGLPFNVTVSAVDGYWNVNNNTNPTVAFSSTDGSATLPAATTLASGTTTVSAAFGTLNASPTTTITATDQASLLSANTGTGVSVITPYQFKSVANGNWSNTNTWSLSSNGGVSWVTPATTIPYNDYVVIQSNLVTNDVVSYATTLTVNAGGTLACNAALNIVTNLDVFGTIINLVANGITLANSATATFENGGTYQHNQNGGAIPTATWNATSTCAITGWTTGTIFTNGLSQAFGNFTWNNPSQTTNVDLEGFLTTVNGNLEIDSTGAGGLYNDNQTGTGVLAIQGNLTINGGNYGGYGGSASVAGKKTYWLLGGNLTLAGGTFYNNTNSSASSSEIFFTNNVGWGSANATISQTGGSFIWDKIEMAIVSGKTVSLATDFTLLNPSANTNRAFTVAGTLDCGSHVLSNLNSGVASAGSESFVLADGGTLKIGSTNGIDSTGATGNIQGFSQGIIFSTAANYVYNGTSGQKMGAGLPATVSSLTIANTAAAVTNTQPLVVTNLTVASGAALDFNGFTNIVVSAPSLGGKLIMEVNRVGANAFTGSQLDLSSGTLAYGGTLNVIATGSTLAAGDSIPLFSAGSYSGNFTATNLPTLGSGLAWNTSALNTSGSIAVVSSSVAPPTILPVQTDGAGNLLISVSTVVGHNYILVATTNLNSPIIWTTNSTTGGTGGIITNSVYINPAKPTQFFRYQVQ